MTYKCQRGSLSFYISINLKCGISCIFCFNSILAFIVSNEIVFKCERLVTETIISLSGLSILKSNSDPSIYFTPHSFIHYGCHNVYVIYIGSNVLSNSTFLGIFESINEAAPITIMLCHYH